MSVEVFLRHRRGAFALDVGFVVQGGVTALFGPSGAGKSSIVSAEWVRTKLKEIVERSMQAVPVMVRGSNGEMVESGEYKYDSNGANKALEHLGKHIGMFKDTTVITIETELKQLTPEQLTARTKALVDELQALDLVQGQDGVFRDPADVAAQQQLQGEANERPSTDGPDADEHGDTRTLEPDPPSDG